MKLNFKDFVIICTAALIMFVASTLGNCSRDPSWSWLCATPGVANFFLLNSIFHLSDIALVICGFLFVLDYVPPFIRRLEVIWWLIKSKLPKLPKVRLGRAERIRRRGRRIRRRR